MFATIVLSVLDGVAAFQSWEANWRGRSILAKLIEQLPISETGHEANTPNLTERQLLESQLVPLYVSHVGD